MKNVLSVVFLIAFFAWAVGYVRYHLDEFAAVTEVSFLTLSGLVLIFGCILYVNGLYTRLILSAFGIRLKSLECLALSVASTAGNYMTFFHGGAGFRAFYLNVHYRFSFSRFISTLSVMYLMIFMVNGMLGLAGMGLVCLDEGRFDAYLGAVFAVLILFSLTILIIPIRLPECNRFPLRELSQIINGWNEVRKNPWLVIKLLVNTTVGYALLMIQTKLAFSAYGVSLTWGAIMCFSATKGLALLASITPGALGVVEWASVYMGETLNYTATQALMAQGLMRIVTFATLFLAGPVAARFLGMRLSRNPDRPYEEEPRDEQSQDR